MPKSTSPSILEASLEAYRKLVATIPGVEPKGATMPYTSKNGHMSSFLTKTGALALRLPDKERREFLAGGGKPCVQHGTILKEYVELPATMLKKTKQLQARFRASHDYVASLKPKPTKKRPSRPKGR